jgi:hypothetical protein
MGSADELLLRLVVGKDPVVGCDALLPKFLLNTGDRLVLLSSGKYVLKSLSSTRVSS